LPLALKTIGKSILKTTHLFSFSINHVQCFDGFWSLYDAKRLRTFMPTSGSITIFKHWDRIPVKRAACI